MPGERNLGGSVGKQEAEMLALRIYEVHSSVCLNEYGQ